MAITTLDDFNLIVPTAAHKMVRRYNDSITAGSLDSDTKKRITPAAFPGLAALVPKR